MLLSLLFLFAISTILFLTGCVRVDPAYKVQQGKGIGPDGLVGKTYHHPDYNFTIDIPDGWGGYQVWGNTFLENEPFCESCENFGPKVPKELPGMDIAPYLMLVSRYAKNEPNFQSTKSGYEKMNTTFSAEQRQGFRGWTLLYSGGTDVTDKCEIKANTTISCDESDQNGKYIDSHWLIDRGDYLYDFVYNRAFHTHTYILASIHFDDDSSIPFTAEVVPYENVTYGYSLILPKSWGAIQPFDGKFVPVYDDADTIGPKDGNADNYIEIDVFNGKNSARKLGESWLDFYKNTILNRGEKYTIGTVNNNYPLTEVTLSDAGGKYERTCDLMEGNDKLYTFCFNRDDEDSLGVVRSFKLI